MKSILIYTFRTFPYIKKLNSVTDEVFVLGSLKEDFLKLEKLILENEYDYIIGVAKSNKISVFETKGVNRFNKGKILKEGKDSYSLDYPHNGYLKIGVNNSYTKSFCNWGIYKVAKFVVDNKLPSKHSFVHIQEKDIPVLRQYLELE